MSYGNPTAHDITRATSRRAFLAAGVAATAAGTAFIAAPAQAEPASAGSPDGTRPGARVRTGADVAAAADWRMFRGTKLGLFSNPSGVLANTRHIIDSMAAHGDLDLVAAFGPEHGFRGSQQAGGSEGDTVDPRTGIPVYDAYDADPAKFAELFTQAGLETLVWDIQEISARFYTRIWIMYRAMWAAAELGLRFVILDRPNPLGGRADGPMMLPEHTSAVGFREIVQQHGMSVGELARFFAGELLPEDTDAELDLDVVKVQRWRPSTRAQEHGLPWPPPSPNIPTPDSALVYVGTAYFEATNLSEGRGTTRPFEFIGAPYLDYHWCDRLNERNLPGVEFREAYFQPTFSKHQGEECTGVQLHVTDIHQYRPIPTAVAMLVEARRYDEFEWRETSPPFWIDRLSGSSRLRTMIDAGADVDEIAGAWEDEVHDFDERRQQYFLYAGPRA